MTIVLVDDRGYGMLRFDQARVGDEPFGVDLAALVPKNVTPDLHGARR